MKRFGYLKKDYINKYFCHELFQHVFMMFSHHDITQASLVCHLWHDHIQHMRNSLFRRYYEVLGGSSMERGAKVEWWEEEVKHMLTNYKKDLDLYHYAITVHDDSLMNSVLDDGGLVIDVCKYIVEVGGRVPVADLLINFQKQVASQTQKSEIIDILDYMCDTLTCVDGDDDDDEAVVFVCLKDFLENGKFIKDVRLLFMQEKNQVDLAKMFEWMNQYCTARKYADTHKKEMHEFLEILADRFDDGFASFYGLKKVYTTKRLL